MIDFAHANTTANMTLYFK